jgi:hemerythrin-like metal-binding protein
MNAERFIHYKTGYKQIDEEHFAILRGMDKIIELCKAQPADTDLIKQSLEELDSALHLHFESEEKLMAAANYKFAAVHATAHVNLGAQISLMLHPRDFNQRHIGYIVKDLEYLIVTHIDSYDMQIKL